MNQENLLLLKELLPAISLNDILHAYSSYMAASCVGWVLVAVFTVWSGIAVYKIANYFDESDDALKIMVSVCGGLVGFVASLLVLDSIIKAIFPLGALISSLAQ